MNDSDEAYTPGEVARLFRVDPKTVTRWADRGKIASFRTPGGHRRYRAGEVNALLGGTAVPRAAAVCPDGDVTLTSRQVARFAGVDVSTAQRWASDGKLAASRTASGRWEFRAGEVRAFLASRRTGGAAAIPSSRVGADPGDGRSRDEISGRFRKEAPA